MNLEEELDIKRRRTEINKLLIGTFETEIGVKCLNHLKTTFVDRDIYKRGFTLDEVAFRQGEASVIKKIIKALEESFDGN